MSKSVTSSILAIVVFTSSLMTLPGWAVTRNVPAQFATIQSAIDAAADYDTIIVAAGTYYEKINFNGKPLTLTSANPDDPNVVTATIIDGSNILDPNNASVVTFNSGETNDTILTGFTITGGTGSWLLVSWDSGGLRWNRCGGGVLCYNMSEPTIEKNVFRDNLAGQGGAIYVYGDPVNPNSPSDPLVHITPVIRNNQFINNSALIDHGFDPPDTTYPNNDHGDGGAIVGFQGCDLIIENNVIQNNTATFYGGGVHLRQWSHGSITKNHVVENSSALGGGVHITYHSSPTVADNLIEKNWSGSLGGGGIYIYFRSDPLVERNIIMKNQSTSGAGIAVYFSSDPVIRNNLIIKNKNGAGIRVRTSSNPYILFNTIAENSASINSGGIECTLNAQPFIENNIITNSGQGYGIISDNASAPVITYNNIWNNAAGNYGPALADQTGINGNISIPPDFINPSGNDYHLKITSGCMNTGNPAYAGTPPIDFDGNVRKIGAFVDPGCFETFQIWNITSSEKFLTIQEAINSAQNDDRLVAAIGIYEENLNFLGKNIHLCSTDPTDWSIVEKTVIDGSNTDSVVIFENGETLSCLLSGFTITNGNAQTDFGGGLRIRNFSSPTIKNNIITNSSAKKGSGISIYLSSARILNNRIFNNTGVGVVSQGGGMMLINCLLDPNAVVANNIIVGNTVTYGGGIRVQNSTAQILNNVIAYNRATFNGLGFYGEGDLLENCIVWGNFNPAGGGSAIYQASAVYSCIDDPVPGQGNIMIDPDFANPGGWNDAGTPTLPDDDFFVYGNYHLPPSSPCIDTAQNSALPGWLTEDIDGEPRITNSLVDIGADEFFRPPADINLDGLVDIFDLFIQNNDWLKSGNNMPGDLFEDQFIDMADYALFQRWWDWQGPWILP